jgi:hypothetical protein
MKTNNLPTTILVLFALIAATGGGYTLARLVPDSGPAPALALPPLLRLDLPPQTQNGITASIESYYADALRLVFQVRVTGADGWIDRPMLLDQNGEVINSSTGFGPVFGSSVSQIEYKTLTPISGDRLRGQLQFSIVAAPGNGGTLADFQFDLDIPIHPALTFNPRQTVWANGIEVLLDRVIITPAYTQAYLCYLKPTHADWAIGYDTTVSINGRTAGIQEYGLLYDSEFGDTGKGGEADWAPPIESGRCVKVGFPVGNANPRLMTLIIPTLEQSLPEVIPAESLIAAYQILEAEGIEMEWHTVDNGAYPEYKKLPPGMTEQEAYRRFIEALGYIYPGTWEFDWQFERDSSARRPSPHPISRSDALTVTHDPMP